MARNNFGQYGFYLPSAKKETSRFPRLIVYVELQRHDLSSCKSATGKTTEKLIERYPLIAYNETEICFAYLFDALVLLRLHFITLFQTTYLQKRSLWVGSRWGTRWSISARGVAGNAKSSGEALQRQSEPSEKLSQLIFTGSMKFPQENCKSFSLEHAGGISVVDEVLTKRKPSKFMSSKDIHLISNNLASAVWSFMMLVNGQTPSCCFFARLQSSNLYI